MNTKFYTIFQWSAKSTSYSLNIARIKHSNRRIVEKKVYIIIRLLRITTTAILLLSLFLPEHFYIIEIVWSQRNADRNGEEERDRERVFVLLFVLKKKIRKNECGACVHVQKINQKTQKKRVHYIIYYINQYIIYE